MVRALASTVLTARLARVAPRGPRLVTVLQQRQFGASPRYLEDAKPQNSFKTQLFESTHQRLKRERAEHDRFSQQQPPSPGGRYTALMFGMLPGNTPPSSGTSPAIVLIKWCSTGPFHGRCLLSRLAKVRRRSHLVHYLPRRSTSPAA